MIKKQIVFENIDKLKTDLKREVSSYMKECNFSQYDVAKICDLPAPYINQILSSKTKSVSLEKLCQVAKQVGLKLTLVVEKK